MSDLIPPDGATEKEIDAFLVSARADAQKRMRERLASGASSDDAADYLASLEPPSEDEVTPGEVAP